VRDSELLSARVHRYRLVLIYIDGIYLPLCVYAVHRSSPQAAWVEPGTQAQALLTHFMLKSTALSPKPGMIDYNSHSDVPDTAPGSTSAQQKGASIRGYRSQPSSPARTRRKSA
jgi:hypothetical protein